MPRTSMTDLFVFWQTLIDTARASGGEAPGLEVYAVQLEELLAEAREINALQETRRALRQAGTELRVELIEKGKGLAIKLQSVLKAHFGHRNPRLVEFGMRPVPVRKKRRAEDEEPAPETPEPAPPPTQPE